LASFSLGFIVTFFAIATKKVTKEKSRPTVFAYRWSLIVYRKARKTSSESRKTNLPARSALPAPHLNN
jgi:hypothetical protein